MTIVRGWLAFIKDFEDCACNSESAFNRLIGVCIGTKRDWARLVGRLGKFGLE